MHHDANRAFWFLIGKHNASQHRRSIAQSVDGTDRRAGAAVIKNRSTLATRDHDQRGAAKKATLRFDLRQTCVPAFQFRGAEQPEI